MQLHSENINEIACALAKAQSEITAPEKDKKNPHFKNSYASLGSVISSCKKALNNNGISVLQPLEVVNGEFVIATMLTHTGGQWIKSIAPIKPVKNDPQSFGSALTYMKRYSLASMLCIDADEDDDGDEACKPATQSIDQNKDTKAEESHNKSTINPPQPDNKPINKMEHPKKIKEDQLADIVEWVGGDKEWGDKILAAYKVPKFANLPESAYLPIKQRHEERSKCA